MFPSKSNPEGRMSMMMLKKVWGVMMLSGHNRERSSCSVVVVQQRGDLGSLEQLPSDILFQILRILGPKEAAKLCVICKAFRFILSDNRLWLHFLQTHHSDPSWDTVFFAETTLASGYPLPLVFFFPSQHFNSI